MKEIIEWLRSFFSRKNDYFTDHEDLEHEIQELKSENDILKSHIDFYENILYFKKEHLFFEAFENALKNFLVTNSQSDTSKLLTEELKENRRVKIQIAGKEVNRKKIKQAFGNLERYLTIDIQERGLYYSLIFKRR